MNRIEAISGFPPCPLCDRTLSLRNMPNLGESHWHCKGCGTEWEVADQVFAILKEAGWVKLAENQTPPDICPYDSRPGHIAQLLRDSNWVKAEGGSQEGAYSPFVIVK